MKSILLLSGTSEGPPLARALAEVGFDVLATVTREEARSHLFGDVPPRVSVEVHGFTAETLTDFLRGGQADVVVDATHPFAVRITQIAREVCGRLGVPLVRYERPDWPPPEGTAFADSFAEAATMLPTLGQRVMLTIGAKQLKHFVHLQEGVTLFARILPSPLSVQQAVAAGFRQDRLLCLRPPFSREFNEALFRAHRVDVLLTKASGIEGGVVEKVEAARILGMKVLMIRRPILAGPSAVSTIAAAVAACRALTATPADSLEEKTSHGLHG